MTSRLFLLNLRIAVIQIAMRAIDRVFVRCADLHRIAMAHASHYYINAYARRNAVRDHLQHEALRPVLGQAGPRSVLLVSNPCYRPVGPASQRPRLLALLDD